MCGIYGATGARLDREARDVVAGLEHRGPDGECFYADPDHRLLLGVRRLSVVDIEGGTQPLANEDGTVWAALNGEIYNFHELRTQLQARGHDLRTRSDTEVLVHLYEDFGCDLVHALDGMFAFAIWDQAAGLLLLARDRFGEKPLFVRRSRTGVAFASELSALVERSKRPALDPEAVDAYFTLGYVAGPASIVNGIEQLLPGHSLEWRARDGATSSQRYWRPARFSAGGPRESIGELRAETLRLLDQSVQRSLHADVPVGVFLSGGIDSALLTALATRHLAQPVDTFSVGYDVGSVSELDAARKTAQALKTNHHELLLTEQDVGHRVPRLFGALDQPLADPALVPLHAIAELAREHVTVAVGGEGADELFGGYPRYRWLARSTALRKVVPAPARRAALRALTALPAGSRVRRFAELLDSELTLERHIDWVTGGRRLMRHSVYGERMAALADQDCMLDRMHELLPNATGPIGAHGFMALDQRSWLPDDVLAKADRAGMLNSLEIRSPYLARDLAEFANSIPADVHLVASGKQLLRAVLEEVAPSINTNRPKTAFRVPGAEWLRGPLAGTLRDQVEDGRLVSEGWFDRSSLRSMVRDHVDHRSDLTAPLWPFLALSVWYEGFSRNTA